MKNFAINKIILILIILTACQCFREVRQSFPSGRVIDGCFGGMR